MSLREKDVWKLSYSELKEEKSRLDQIAMLDQGQSQRLDTIEKRLADYTSKAGVQTMY